MFVEQPVYTGSVKTLFKSMTITPKSLAQLFVAVGWVEGRLKEKGQIFGQYRKSHIIVEATLYW